VRAHDYQAASMSSRTNNGSRSLPLIQAAGCSCASLWPVPSAKPCIVLGDKGLTERVVNVA
jgi:hypothetical protein